MRIRSLTINSMNISTSKDTRIVVTGVGMVTSLGVGVKPTWDGIISGKSGIRAIPPSLFQSDDLASRVAGYIPAKAEGFDIGLDVEDFLDSKAVRTTDRFIQLALIAADEAVKDADLVAENEEEQERIGVLVGSGIGGLLCIENNAGILLEKGPRRISPFFIPASLINLVPGHISIKYGFRGPNYSVVTACASGAHAIGESARLIACGEADAMVCGASEAAICRLGIAGFASARALSTKYNDDPTRSSRPWDKGRDGFVMGEGAGIVVIESLERATKRGAKIYGELIGYGLTGDAYHITSPEPTGNGGYRAMKQALRKAGITPDQIDYINAHGTSTPPGDLIEFGAVMRIFEGYDHTKVHMSSTKSAIGHLLGAAGSVEAIFCLLAMADGVVPPTLNLDEVDENCVGIDLVAHKAIEKDLKIVMSNSFGFGGTNASLIFAKV